MKKAVFVDNMQFFVNLSMKRGYFMDRPLFFIDLPMKRAVFVDKKRDTPSKGCLCEAIQNQ